MSAVMSPRAFLPPQPGRENDDELQELTLSAMSPLKRGKRNLQDSLVSQKYSPSPSPTARVGADFSLLLPLSAAFRANANLSWRHVLPIRASYPLGRMLPPLQPGLHYSHRLRSLLPASSCIWPARSHCSNIQHNQPHDPHVIAKDFIAPLDHSAGFDKSLARVAPPALPVWG